MGIRNTQQVRGLWGRATFNVPAVAGNYANERITIGLPAANQAPEALAQVLAVAKNLVTGAALELWVPEIASAAGGSGWAALTDADYTLLSALSLTATAFALSASLVGWPVVQVRMKSGGTQGATVVSASAI